MSLKSRDFNHMEEELLARSFLFDSPSNYRAGVTATIRAVRRSVAADGRRPSADTESPYLAVVRGDRLDPATQRARIIHMTDREMKLLSTVC